MSFHQKGGGLCDSSYHRSSGPTFLLELRGVRGHGGVYDEADDDEDAEELRGAPPPAEPPCLDKLGLKYGIRKLTSAAKSSCG